MNDFEREELSVRTDDSEHLDFFPTHYRVGRTKYIIVTGGVMSGVGKGVFAASRGTWNAAMHRRDFKGKMAGRQGDIAAMQ